jgi:RNA polymerase sigma-70 factor (ECF subfamily)
MVKDQTHMLNEEGLAIPFGQIYDQHFNGIFNYILRRTANVAEAEDLTAQVFFLAMRHAARQSQKPTNIPAWLYRIATNEVNGYFRRRKRRPLAASLGTNEELQEIQDRETEEAERLMERNRIFIELNGALRALKTDDQSVIALRYFEQMSFEEMAQILGKRVGAVTMRTHRALNKLQHELTRRGISHERFREGFTGYRQTRYPSTDLSAESTP